VTEPTRTPGLPAISRRQVLVGGALAGVAAFVAACGTSGTAGTPTPSPAASPSPAGSAGASPSAAPSEGVTATPSAEVNWANWSYYMDVDPNDTSRFPSLELFTAKYGTKVNYQEIIEGNEDFFGKIRGPIQAGKDTGWDVMTLTDWMAARLIRLGWVEKFALNNMPNFVANLKDVYKGLDWDPTPDQHAPWRSGMTSLGMNTDKTGNVTSLMSLFTADPKWKGKVEYLTEMRDAIGLAMLAQGLDPSKATRDDCDKAVALMQQAKADGVIRDVKGQSYTEDLKNGDAVLAMAWSGDMVQAQIDLSTLVFVLATEGGMLWTDNSMIPKGAVHKGTAELLIDWYYQPANSALVSAGVDYISPCKGSDELLVKAKPEEANNPLINPPADWLARLYDFAILTEADETYFNEQFAKVIGVG
jgi:spermidine/putrescine transport system substrate-binding protein